MIEINVEIGPGVYFVIPLIVSAVIAEENADMVDACQFVYPIDPRDDQWDSHPGIRMASEHSEVLVKKNVDSSAVWRGRAEKPLSLSLILMT